MDLAVDGLFTWICGFLLKVGFSDIYLIGTGRSAEVFVIYHSKVEIDFWVTN